MSCTDTQFPGLISDEAVNVGFQNRLTAAPGWIGFLNTMHLKLMRAVKQFSWGKVHESSLKHTLKDGTTIFSPLLDWVSKQAASKVDVTKQMSGLKSQDLGASVKSQTNLTNYFHLQSKSTGPSLNLT